MKVEVYVSRKYMNGRWCVRCHRQGMTPFLRTSVSAIRHAVTAGERKLSSVTVIDIGCGNGRNMEGLRELGFGKVSGYDMCADAPGSVPVVLGHTPFPCSDGKADVILANYVFMFLDEAETTQVLREINRSSHAGSMLVLELYPAKDSRIRDDKQMLNMQHDLYEELMRDAASWASLRWCKGKFLLRRTR